jgi:hypothetical protein
MIGGHSDPESGLYQLLATAAGLDDEQPPDTTSTRTVETVDEDGAGALLATPGLPAS